jgi:predicted acetyltransferase
MSVDIAAVPLPEKADLWTLFQRYAAELAPLVNLQPTNGVYSYDHFDDYWQDGKSWPFWAMQDGERIGFALVRFVAESGAMQMAEFYVLPEYRKGGHGFAFAQAVLKKFPGPWKIRQILANGGATAFWRKVAAAYGYTEERFAVNGIDRIEQTLTV